MSRQKPMDLVAVGCVICGMPCRASYTYDPGVHTYSNGDPGYPPDEEIDWHEVCECAYWQGTVQPDDQRYVDAMDRKLLNRLQLIERREAIGLRLLPIVYVAYAWAATQHQWLLLGFVRLRSELRLRRMERFRLRFTLPSRNAPFKMMELFVAAAYGPGGDPHD